MRNKSACPRHLLLAVLLCGAVSSNARAECVGYVPTCSLRTSAAVVFLGTLESESNRVYRFRVDEPFNGVKGKSIDILDMPMIEGFSGFAGVGRQYLVFASTIKLDDGVHAYIGGCGRNLVGMPYGRDVLEQLHREKSGRRISTVYGTLIRTMYHGIRDNDYRGPLPGVTVTFQAGDRSF